MTILKECKGNLCLERYGRYYIRFWSGYNSDIPCEFPISEDEMHRVLADESQIRALINRAKETIVWTDASFYRISVCEYLLYHLNLSQTRTEQAYQKLSRHPDILREFHFFIMGEPSMWKPISVEGYTAAQILQQTSLNPLGAYNYLIYLRENPTEAIMNLKKGLPIRRVFREQDIPVPHTPAEDDA